MVRLFWGSFFKFLFCALLLSLGACKKETSVTFNSSDLDIEFSSKPGETSTDTTPTFNFAIANSSETSSEVDYYECAVNGAEFTTCGSPYTAPALSDGLHELRVRAVDDKARKSKIKSYTWRVTTLTLTGDAYHVSQVGSLWSVTFTASGGTGGNTYSLPVNPVGATVNASGQVSFTPGSYGKRTFVLQVADSAGMTANHSFNVDSYDPGICVWNGSVSTAWATAANWSFCSGVAPTATDVVAVGTSTNQPTLGVAQTIDSIALGVGGGTINLQPGGILSISNTAQSIRSSVQFVAQAGCTTCRLYPAGDLSVVDNATLTLGIGVDVLFNRGAFKLNIGDGATAGHLVTSPGTSTEADWPHFYGKLGSWKDDWLGILVHGTAGIKSSVNIDGIFLDDLVTGSTYKIRFIDHYEIGKFDNIKVET